MGTKAEALAARFEQASQDFGSKIRGLNDSEWRAKTPEEGWTVVRRRITPPDRQRRYR